MDPPGNVFHDGPAVAAGIIIKGSETLRRNDAPARLSPEEIEPSIATVPDYKRSDPRLEVGIDVNMHHRSNDEENAELQTPVRNSNLKHPRNFA